MYGVFNGWEFSYGFDLKGLQSAIGISNTAYGWTEVLMTRYR